MVRWHGHAISHRPLECLSRDAVYRIVSALSPAVDTDALQQILALLLLCSCSLPFREMEYRKTAANPTGQIMTWQLSSFVVGWKISQVSFLLLVITNQQSFFFFLREQAPYIFELDSPPPSSPSQISCYDWFEYMIMKRLGDFLCRFHLWIVTFQSGWLSVTIELYHLLLYVWPFR